MKSKVFLALTALALGLPAFCNPAEPITYSSTLEEVLNKTSAYSWTVKSSQVLLKEYSGAELEEALAEWNNGGNTQKSPKITITGKPSKGYESIYFKPCQNLVMELVDADTNTYQDNFRMSGIVAGSYVDAKGKIKPQILNTKNVTFTSFLNAITNDGGNLTFSKTNFIKNKSATNGGAIYNESGAVTVNGGSTLMYNLAEDKGGAIYNKGSLVVKGATIGGQHNEGIYHICTPTVSGEAEEYHVIRNDDIETSTAVQTSPNLDSNGNYQYTVDGYLGSDDWLIIYYLVPEWRDTRKVNWADEENNFNSYWVHIYPLGNEAKYGAGIYNDGKASITNTVFKYNVAKADSENEGGYGGGIYNNGNLTVKGSEFYYNKAVRGGGLYNAGDGTTNAVVQKTSFNTNRAECGAGAYVESGNITFSKDTFGTYGQKPSNIATFGGGIYNEGANTNIVSSTFSNNYAEKGGDVYNKGTINISKSTFGYLPKTRYFFEAVRSFYITDPVGEYTVDSDTYVVSPIGYGPVNWVRVEYTIGSSAIQGGAIYNEGTATVTSSIFNETTAQEGGAIYNKGTMTLKQSTFKKSNSTEQGGAIFASSGTLTDTKSTFNGNYSKQGGAVYVDTDGTATFNSSTFILNNAYETVTDDETQTTKNLLTEGGAIYNKGELKLNSVTFGNKKQKYKYTNQAKYGAALYNSGTAVSETSNILYQESGYGTVYNKGDFTSIRDNFSFNKAALGGAVYNAVDATATVEGSTFTSNSATCGGAVYNEGELNISVNQYTYKKNKKLKTATVTPVFRKNTATVGGGAIYLANTSRGEINNAQFTSNKAYSTTSETTTDETTKTVTTVTTPSGAGGAIYVGQTLSEDISENPASSGPPSVNSSVFTSNSAGLKGGAVAVEDNGIIDINNSKFTKNNAYSSITTTIKTTVTSGKKTKTVTTSTKTYQGMGGAVYLGENTTVKLIGNTFTSNYANLGGAVFLSSGNVTLTNNIFDSNSAKGVKGNYGYGGAIYLNEGVTASLTGGKFNKNTAYMGGAIYMGKNGFFNFENTNFTSNTATAEGGAIYISAYEKPAATDDDNENVNTDDTSGTNDGDNQGADAGDTSGTNDGDNQGDNQGDNTGDTSGTNDGDNQGDNQGDTPSDTPSETSDEPTPMKFKNVNFSKNKAEFGGAIFNSGHLEISDSTLKDNKANAYGGAIYNVNVLTVDNTTFDNNASSYGGALFNFGSATFTNTKFLNTKSVVHDAGGAIYNAVALVVSNSEFKGNIARAFGGAVINYQANQFYSPSTESTSNQYISNQAYYGGAVASYSGMFVSKNDTFTKNFAMQGGAVHNFSTFSADNGAFENNSAYYGGGIYSAGSAYYANITIENSSFSGNRGIVYAGAMYLSGTKAKIENTVFTGNYAELYGGAVLIASTKDYADINSSEFTGNYVNSDGGAVFNVGNLNFNIVPEEENNDNNQGETAGDTSGTNDDDNQGDNAGDTSGINDGDNQGDNADDTSGTNDGDNQGDNAGDTSGTNDGDNQGDNAGDNNGDTPSDTPAENPEVQESVTYTTIKFDKNKADNGGAIYNLGVIKGTNLSFTNNSVTCFGGAIHNTGYVELSDVTFLNNNAYIKKLDNKGGAIYNNPTKTSTETSPQGLKLTNARFGNNSADLGGAIYSVNSLTIADSVFGTESETSDPDETAVILGNTATKNGGAIFNTGSAEITNTTFNSNSAANGGAIYTENYTQIGEDIIDENNQIPSDASADYNESTQTNKFISNNATNGGAIYNTQNLYVNGAEFKQNTALSNGGGIYNSGSIVLINTTFDKNSASSNGGALYHSSKDGYIVVVNSLFKNNTAKNGGAVYVGPNSYARFVDVNFFWNSADNKGGAIYAGKNSVIDVFASNRNVEFSGNTANGESNSIHLDNATINFTADTNREISVNDPISGKGRINTSGDVYIKNRAQIVSGSDISIYNEQGKITVQNDQGLNGANLSLSSTAILSTANGSIGTMSLKSITSDNSNVNIDVDLKNNVSDKITAETSTGTGLNLASVNLVSNSVEPVTVKIGEGSEVKTMSATKAETAEATYKLKASLDENGNLVATAYGQKAKPCTMAAPVAAQLGGYLTQINSYDQAFMNMDINMGVNRQEREARNMANKFAYAGNDYSFTPDNGVNRNGKGLWTRPYVTFERVGLSHGPKVGNIAYGNFFGGDADLKELNNGWKRQFSAYIGYNGSTQDFDRQSVDQNGGTIGVTEVWYKGNFFTGLTANAGANAVNASTDLGHENFPMLMAGVASKTGYNFEFFKGKFIVQPSILLSYSFVHTFSHKNGKGSHVGSSPLHAVQVAPGLKFIGNLPKGWQPYVGINMRWNIIDKTHFSLQDVSIPDMSIRPYVEYGVGLQRKWGERFTGFGQAMIRNGGRNGVMLSFGFRWAIGK